MNFQVETWEVDVGARLALNHYKFCICCACIFLLVIYALYLQSYLLYLNSFLLKINSIHSNTLAHYFSVLIFKVLKRSNSPSLLGLHIWATFVYYKPESVVQLRKEENLRQSSINEKYDKKKRAMVCQYIDRFFYHAGIPFNIARMHLNG